MGVMTDGTGSLRVFMFRAIKHSIAYLKWLSNRKCNHPVVHCIHGDEIILAGYRRSACTTCPAIFDSLPETCTVTGEKHWSFSTNNY
ncbi:hypothetical protein PP914_gp005 [Arthrobacter phage Qui]|uniref:Uncharacterized protein n=1 Tax=Arthrobacter phage Qui TaxID=2603260 RepID=A0A5B8WJW8_9CAUD|nr:hypothetical protein PP914_gp005 [Arthrobacter phage Qui]QED11496.1 hypothetical protein SEA_QUI_5 [Arthrobacter phage Qui]QOC56327.1 hypothetical protein SEA_PAELLA_5 [Arthrobacter phage Paella]